jgi:hypothetical protein
MNGNASSVNVEWNESNGNGFSTTYTNRRLTAIRREGSPRRLEKPQHSLRRRQIGAQKLFVD